MSVLGNIVSAIFPFPTRSKRDCGRGTFHDGVFTSKGFRGIGAGQADFASRRTKHLGEVRRQSNREARLESIDCRSDEVAETGQQPRRTQTIGARTRLHRCSQRLAGNEHLAAQAGHDQGRRERRQGAGKPQDVGSNAGGSHAMAAENDPMALPRPQTGLTLRSACWPHF